MTRKIKLLKWEADTKKGEIRVEFENNWFLEGEHVISNDGKIDLRIEKYINDNIYMCSFHNLQREIEIGEKFSVSYVDAKLWNKIFK